jgi:hypothetical protein
MKTKSEEQGATVETKIPVPPYVPYKSLRNFLDALKVNIPSRIDRSVMPSMSGALQSQLIAALRYLGLISEKGIPTQLLTSLVNSEGTLRQGVLKEMLTNAYPFLFKGFDLGRATTRQIEEQFSHAGAGGETVRKCIAFFMGAAKDAEIPLSPHIKPFKGVTRLGTRQRRVSVQQNGTSTQSSADPQPTGEGYMTWAQLLLSKFPSFDPTWPDDVKAKWFSAFDQLMQQGAKKGLD